MSKITQVRLLLSSIITLFVCLPATGFVYGLIVCDCDHTLFGETLGRVFVGFVEALVTSITLGKPWDNEGGTSSTNIRPFVLLGFFLIATMIYLLLGRSRKKKS